MATSSLPEFRKFDVESEPTSVGIRWKAWLAEFENLLVALAVEDKKRQRALMLYYAGKEVHDIYKSLVADDANEDFEMAKEKLTLRFEPKVNKTYEIYHFRKLQQGVSEEKFTVSEDEPIDSFVTRLRKKAARCGFTDADTEIKYQIIFGCKDSKLRRAALQKDELTLEQLVSKGRTVELSEKQSKVIESDCSKSVHRIDEQNCPTYAESCENGVRKINKRPGKYSSRSSDSNNEKRFGLLNNRRTCFSCGGSWPHPGGRAKCPAKGQECKNCKKQDHFAAVCRAKSHVKQIKDEEPSDTSTDSDDSYVFKLSENGPKNTKPLKQQSNKVKLKIRNKKLQVKIDTCSDVNIIDEVTFELIKDVVNLKKTNIKLFGYNSKIPLKTLGKFREVVESKKKMVVADFYVLKGRCGSLINADTAQALNLIRFTNKISTKESIINDFGPVFKGIG